MYLTLEEGQKPLIYHPLLKYFIPLFNAIELVRMIFIRNRYHAQKHSLKHLLHHLKNKSLTQQLVQYFPVWVVIVSRLVSGL